jgi:hypothetical protein
VPVGVVIVVVSINDVIPLHTSSSLSHSAPLLNHQIAIHISLSRTTPNPPTRADIFLRSFVINKHLWKKQRSSEALSIEFIQKNYFSSPI